MKRTLTFFLVIFMTLSGFAQKKPGGKKQKKRDSPIPTVPDIAYGDHEKQRFDMWPVPGATEPTPLAIRIHGGGFIAGDKQPNSPYALTLFHDAGIAYCSINYRLSGAGTYPIMMKDAARALQTIRHRAKEWNIDPDKIACYGDSAGAGISLWLAFHDDLADPDSDDPIARQSTRIVAAATINGQSTYDRRTFREWFGVPNLKMDLPMTRLYGVKEEADWESDRVKKMMTDASPITHLSKDDTAAVYMEYKGENTPIDASTKTKVWVHHVKLGLKLQEAMKALDLECIVRAPGIVPEEDPYKIVTRFIAKKLQAAK